MTKRMREILAQIQGLQTEAKQFRDEKKFDDAETKLKEIATLQKEFEVEKAILEQEKKSVPNHVDPDNGDGNGDDGGEKKAANTVRAIVKVFSKQPLTNNEKSLLLPTSTATNGSNGEGYILPKEISTKIHEKVRQYKSFREVLGYLPAGALTGTFPVENFETVSGLVDFADGTDGTDGSDISFTNVDYALKEKAAFIKLSNTLLTMTDNNLIDYVSGIFAKKAVMTENAMALAILKKDKTVKSLADWKALKSSLNVDLDPAVDFGTVIVTNQNGYDYLDKQLDTVGRPLLQPDISAPGKKTFAGKPVIVFSNTLMPSTAATTTKAEKTPIFYGNLAEAASFVDLQGLISFAASKEAGFMSNTTIARLIEFLDVIKTDNSDKVYIYGELETAPKTA